MPSVTRTLTRAAILLCALCVSCASGESSWGQLRVRVLDEASGEPMRCKLLLLTAAGEPVQLGGARYVGRWVLPHVLASDRALYGDPCDMTLSVPAQSLQLQASAGIEWELARADVTVRPDETAKVELRLARALDTSGYACADLHVHSAPSFDSEVPLDQRLIGALGEGLDAIVPTDHEAVGDWEAELARTGLSEALTLVLGDEVTPDIWPTPQSIGHFGVFPVPHDFDPSQHQLSFQTPGSLLERLDQLYPDSLIQLNHPRWDAIGYFNVAGFDPADPTLDAWLGLSHLDAIELWNSNQNSNVGGAAVELMLQDYYRLLDMGFALVATGNTDTHDLSTQPLGYPRNCIRVANDRHPGLEVADLLDGLRLGRVLVTSGPWLEVSIEGHGPGEMVESSGTAQLEVLVDAASWASLDRVHIVVNGHTQNTIQVPSLPTRLQLPLELSSGVSYIMVFAEGDAPLPSVAGELGAPQRSLAFTNPLWVRNTP